MLLPDAEGEDAVEAIEAPFTPFDVRVKENFRVRCCAEHVPQRAQVVTQLSIIVNFTIVGEHPGAHTVAVHHRLFT